MNYKEDLHINENELHLEWLEQPEKTMEYIEYAAQKEKERDELKEKMEFVYATLDRDIRANPERYNISKITESNVESAIKTTMEFREAVQKFNEANYEARIARGAVTAMRDRKEALQELDRLAQLGYISVPKSPHDIYQDRYNKEKRLDEQANDDIEIKSTRRRTK